jgi:uncharacterized lipoprotein YmbA
MHKLLTIAVLLVLGGCATPKEQVLKQMPSASPGPADTPVNCTTIHRLTTTYTTCK